MIAQIIAIATSPILTRVYSPENFNIFGLYLGISTILGVIITGRYEMAILLPKRDNNAVNVLGLSILISMIVSFLIFLTFIILAFFNNVGVRETHEKWSQEVCPKPGDRYPDKGYPQCLTYTYEVKGEQLKKELFHMGCGYNTLAFLGMVTPKQALAEIEKKAMSRYRKNPKEHDAYTLTREIIGHVRNKIKFQRKLTFADLLINRDKEEKRPSKHVGAWSSLTSLIILDKTLEQASKANNNREVSVIVYERFYRDFAGHTVVFNYNNSTLWMYDPQMIKGEREVLSEKGVKAFNYRTFGGLVLIVPDNSRKSKKRRVKNTKRTKKK